jgi:transcriptional regulator with XRE-family HTH domain
MPRRPTPFPHFVANIRAWFGLHLHELALYMGVSKALVQGIENGRLRLTPAVSTALLPLLLQLPPPEVVAAAEATAVTEDAPPAPASGPPLALLPGTPLPDAADLDFRRRVCQQQAGRALAQASTLAQRARVAARWAAVLPALLPPDPDDPTAAALDPEASPAARALVAALALAADPDDPARAPDHARWLRGWLARRAQPLPPADSTRYHLLRARAAGLLAEAAALV